MLGVKVPPALLVRAARKDLVIGGQTKRSLLVDVYCLGVGVSKKIALPQRSLNKYKYILDIYKLNIPQ